MYVTGSNPLSTQDDVAAALASRGMQVFGRHGCDMEEYEACLCAALGCFINNEIVPRGHEVRRNLKTKVSVGTGLDLLEPGRIIDDFPKMKLYFGSKEGNWLHDIVVIDNSQDIDRMITASKALVTSEGRDIHLDLYQMTVDPVDADHPTMAQANRFRYVVKDALEKSVYAKKEKDLRFNEMRKRIQSQEQKVHAAAGSSRIKGTERYLRRQSLSVLKTEFSKRFVFAMASLCSVLVGVPLGIKAQRKESSIGMAISFGVSLGYYLLVMLMLSFEKKFVIHPEFLLWLPVVLCLVLAGRLVSRNL